MTNDVSSKEIKDALFDIGDNKAPGLDRYSSVFFKKALKIIGDDFRKAIKEFFTYGKMLNELNSTVISLIPKIQSPLKSGRGLRQGDPMSPYLFTLVMECFTLMMERNVKRNLEFQYHYVCKSMKITHVCFADDLLVLCHGDAGSVKVYKCCDSRDIMIVMPFEKRVTG
ncbi:RNA-directed DNA polymerase, eukaryota, reverse transcriptase zinc-binding domain protein [Tanacetum coccineum]|uniref:RNA-directed DNA polymerase, eukaryota, reverse transcriptase zinc-binding domain protein n=1 Tax=Tanacetum coccineum TaxID=301880 RepID=A0ABQ5AHT6_9ASTR